MSILGRLTELVAGNLQSVLLFTIVFLVVWYYINLPSHLPPGPVTLPLVGSLPFVIARGPLQKLFNSWRSRYGEVFRFYMGSQLILVLNSYEAIKEAYVKNGDAVSGRLQLSTRTEARDGGVVNTEGAAWKEQRRFTLSSLRDFGMGKHRLEYKIQEEIDYFSAELERQKGKPLDITFLMNNAISNVICNIVFGKRFEYDDKEFLQIIRFLNETVKNVLKTMLSDRIPLVRYLPGDPTNHKFILKIRYVFRDWVNKSITEHVEKFDSANILDFIDAHLAQKEENEAAGITDSYITDENLLRVVMDLFGAGTETTSTTMRWALLYMMLYPDVQQKVQDEIDDVVGRERLPSMHDRSKLPYTEAVVLELSRVATIIPLGVPHRSTQSFSLYDYIIPPDTVVLTNAWAVHMDPANFPQPELFKPERFLSEDGTKIKNSDFLIPFGIGRRSCLGESLARMELFLFFSAAMQRFRWQLPEGAPRPDKDKAVSGITSSPPFYQLCALKRE